MPNINNLKTIAGRVVGALGQVQERGINPGEQIGRNFPREDPMAGWDSARTPAINPDNPYPYGDARSRGAADDDFDGVLRGRIRDLITRGTQPQRESQIPAYQPLPEEKTRGWKNRLFSAVKALGQTARNGDIEGPQGLGGLLGSAIHGAMKPEEVNQMDYVERTYMPALRRQAMERAQRKVQMGEMDDQMGLLVKAANAERLMRDSQDVSKVVSNGKYLMMINPRTGRYEILKDDAGNPVPAASVANAETHLKGVQDTNQTRRDTTDANNQTKKTIAEQGNQYKWKAEQYKQGQMNNRQRQSSADANRRAAAGIIARTVDPADFEPTPQEVEATRANPMYSAMSDDQIKAKLRAEKREAAMKNALPNGRRAAELLGGWGGGKK